MNNTLVFIRHAKTKIEKEIPIEDWELTDEGKEQAEDLAKTGSFDDTEVIISSNEHKAYLTIKPLADKLGKEITKIAELGEIKRPDSEKLTSEEYNEMKAKIFQDLDFTDNNWETANHALERFKSAVEKINQEYENKKILICAHGTVMTLYFTSLQNQLDNLMERWKGLEFGAIGIVKNNKVIKDIVK